jgi:hypothetical protein
MAKNQCGFRTEVLGWRSPLHNALPTITLSGLPHQEYSRRTIKDTLQAAGPPGEIPAGCTVRQFGKDYKRSGMQLNYIQESATSIKKRPGPVIEINW